MGIGQPAMKRHCRQFDQKCEQESKHDPSRGGRLQGSAQQIEIIKGISMGLLPMDKIQGKYCQQHQQAPGLGKDEKFKGCIAPVSLSPHGTLKINMGKQKLRQQIKKKKDNAN